MKRIFFFIAASAFLFTLTASDAQALFSIQRAHHLLSTETGYDPTYPPEQFYSPTTGPFTSYDATYPYGCWTKSNGDIFCERRYPAANPGDRYACGSDQAGPNLGIDTTKSGYWLIYNCQFVGDITSPGNATSLQAKTVSNTRIDFSWTPPSDLDIAYYEVHPDREGVLQPIITATAPFLAYTGLSPNTAYGFYVLVVDTTGNKSGSTDYTSATTLAAPPDTTPPSVPTVSATGVSTSQINVSWSPSIDAGAGVAGYEVYRDGTLVMTVIAPTTTYSDTGLSPGTTHSYTARAFDAASPANYSAQSSPASGTTLLAADTARPTVPGAPSAAAVSSSQISLAWGASTDPTVAGQTMSGLAGYRIYRNGSATPTAAVGPTTTTYSGVGLSPSTTYAYRVSAFDNAGNESVQAGPASATTYALPAVSLSASPTLLILGQSMTLTWSSANAASCSASGAWSGARPISDSQTLVPSAAGSYTYTLTCTGPGGETASQSASVSVSMPPPPSVSLSASPTSLTLGQSTMLTWSSANAASCSASGAWSGARLISDSQTVTPSATATYTLSCAGPGGSASQSVTVSVTIPAAPTVSLSASPTSLTLGQSTMLTWSSANAASCSATWTASAAVSGSETLTPLVTTTYSISCTGPGGTVSQSTTVTVSDPPPVFTNPQPSGSLAASVPSVTLSGDTNEDAYCRYDTQAHSVSATNAEATAVFFSMPGSFGAAGTTHSSSAIPVSAGNAYRYYIRCQDNPAGNVNLTDYLIQFSVATPPNASPIAQFVVAPTSGAAPLTVSVDASGSSDPDGSIFQYYWTWGDFSLPDTVGPVTTAQVYPNPGTYIIALRVVDNQGAATTATQTVTVSSAVSPPPPPTAGICVAACTLPNVGCFGTDVCGSSGFCIAAGSGGPGPVRANGSTASLDGTIVILASNPAGSFPSDTTSVTMSLTTDVNATCQYSNVAGIAYDAPGMFSFSSTGLTSHSVRLTGLGGVPTQSYTYTYSARCRDAATGDVNTADYPITFSIGGATLSSGPNPYLCKVNDSFIRSGLPYFFDVCAPRCDTNADCAAPTPTCDMVKKACR